jgi:hypothetical protein
METIDTGQPEKPRINPAIAAEIDNLIREAEGDAASQAEARAAFDDSPVGRWRAAITEIAPLCGMIHPDLTPTEPEVNALAEGMAPALAKHFPDMSVTIPVELVAVVTVWTVFAPKVRTIKARRQAAAENAPQEVNPNASTSA